MPGRRKGSSNPDGYDDPDWYEKPGETVLMDYKPQPGFHVAPRMPWQDQAPAGSLRHFTEVSGFPRVYTIGNVDAICQTCGRSYQSMVLLAATRMLCPYCARIEERNADDAAKRGNPDF